MVKIKLDLEINEANGECIAKGPLLIMGRHIKASEKLVAGIAIGTVIEKFIQMVKDDEDLMMDFVNAVCKPFEEYAKGADKN